MTPHAVTALAGGRLELLAGDERAAQHALELARAPLAALERVARSEAFADGRAWFKAEPLPPGAARRHALRRKLMRRDLPRLAEYANLEWLRAHCFEAPEPLAAGVWWRAGRPRWQFLITREVEDACSLREFLGGAGASPDGSPRGETLAELAREVARMHALRFIHRDLFPRNILVRRGPAARSLVFLDAWRGGARWQLRGAAYDLACLFLQLPEWLAADEQQAWFARYVRERAVQGRAVDAARMARDVTREWRALRRRYERRGRAAELPPAGPANLLPG